MNFFTVQSLNAYTRNMEMQMKWQKKQDTNDFTADGSMRLDNDPTRRQAEEIRKSREDGSDQLAKQIDLKLNSGQKLTAEEMDYLRKHDPQAYQKVKSIEAEQKNYENELKKCKTKEEVERVKMAHTATSLSAVNSIMNNPVIPEEKKFELVMQEHRKNQALQTTAQEFVESGEYAKLPTEAERLKAEKDLQEAKEKELGIEEPSEKAEQEDGSAGKTDADREGLAQDGQVFAEKAVKAAETEKDVRMLSREREMTRMEAETTPEALKVKRAKARAAYQMSKAEVSQQMLDVKVD
ncbi:hypothetical protein AALD74_18705 [Lachnospiraceae bacterium 48-21]|nr:hypothetical protein [Dorea sp.]